MEQKRVGPPAVARGHNLFHPLLISTFCSDIGKEAHLLAHTGLSTYLQNPSIFHQHLLGAMRGYEARG